MGASEVGGGMSPFTATVPQRCIVYAIPLPSLRPVPLSMVVQTGKVICSSSQPGGGKRHGIWTR